MVKEKFNESQKYALKRFNRPVVTLDEFLSTYTEGIENYNDYQTALELSSKRQSTASIAREIGRSYQTVYEWVNNKAKPVAIHGLEKLLENGLIPLNYCNPKFPALNRLAALLFWSGHIEGKYGHGILHIKSPGMMGDIEKLLSDEFDIGSKRAEDYESRQKKILLLVKNSSSYLRLMHKMGIPLSSESEHENKGWRGKSELLFPEYLTRLIKMYHLIKGKSRKIAKDILGDFIKILFNSRLNLGDNNNCGQISLIANKEKKHAEEHLRQVLELFKKRIPSAKINNSDIYYRKKEENYHPAIFLKRENIFNFIKHHPGFFSITPTFTNF